MKKTGILAVCTLALAITASAEESSKAGSAPDGIEVSDLIARVAKRTNKQFVVDSRVRGPIVLAGIEPSQVSYEQLLTILGTYQYAVTESGGILAVVPDANARQFPGKVFTDAGFTAPDNEVVTLLVTPKNVCAPFLVPVLRPLEPQAAHLAADLQTNSLIINDRAVNVRRIANLVEQLDKRGKGLKDCPPPTQFVPSAGPVKEPAKDK